MHRPLIDSEYIYGIHEPGGEAYLLAAEGLRNPQSTSGGGWVLFNEAIGCNPEDRTGIDFTTFSSQGLGVICRLNHGFEPEGALPHSRQYENFARRVANFVAISRGCKIWVIGNEMNYAVERPGIQIDWSRHATTREGPPEIADPLRHGLAIRFNALPDNSSEIRTTRAAIVNQGELITPDLYARCYRLCREAIHRLPGHEDDQVLVGAVAPWNTQTIYAGNANGDWVQYFRDILDLLGPQYCDGFTLHTFTHGPEPTLIADETLLPPPFQNYHRQFRAYRDFLAAVPVNMRHLPVYITETDQRTPWLDVNSGWIQAAYEEINAWNQQARTEGGTAGRQPRQPIRALILYRWPRIDRWYIDGKEDLIEDFQQALQHGYRWEEDVVVVPAPKAEPTVTPSISPPGRSRRSAAPEVPNYLIEWVDDHFPEKLLAGEVITAAITLRNVGSLIWRWGGGNPFRLGYHYYRNRRLLPLPPERDLRTDIPDDVLPGDLVTVTARIALPTEPGNYTLELDLVQEGVAWFKDHKSPVLTRWLTVEAPQVEHPPEDGPMLPVPLLADMTLQLPRKGAYARRSLNQIRYLVVSHTAAHPNLSIERIAQTHLRYGYPGIAYNFVVDRGGRVWRVSHLEEVAQPDQPWSEQGVNICLTGNFSAEAPPLAQLDGAGRLCSWLAHNLGLTPDAIVGLGELTHTDSPGDTFYAGPTWRNVLTRQVQLHLAALNYPGEEEARTGEDLLAAQQQVQELREKNSNLQALLRQSEEERERFRLFNERLQADVADLREQVETTPTPTLAAEGGFRIQNAIEQLPRDAHRYAPRQPEDVRLIVIHHTGVAPTVSWAQIAEAHRQDWPGILYDFGIDVQGNVWQLQPLDEVVETEQVYLAKAISIAFAGEFNQQAPSDEQITAGGKLIAWLLERFPQVKLEQVKGLREFIEHSSPGEQWLSGAGWKNLLLAAARRAGGFVDPTEAEKALRARLGEVGHDLESLQQKYALIERQKTRLESENHRLQAELQEKLQTSKNYVIPKPSMRQIVDQLPKHPNLRYERRSLSQISHIAVHHTAAPPSLNPLRIAEMHVAADPGRGKEAWPGIGYHYFIHADGAIEQTNLMESASYHVYRHNGYSLGVAFAGSFMNGRIPTSAQLRAGAHLIAWLMQDLHIPLARVWGHREFPENSTICPGSEWTLGNRWRDLLFERIEQVQHGIGVKNIRHYLLLPHQTQGGLAEHPVAAALAYIERFEPTVGFSVEDAKYAEYVTIVGSEAIMSSNNAALLSKHGCKVDRIAGRDPEESARYLNELVRLGRRFQEFEVDFE